MRKSRYCFRTLQLTLALYMMWVSLRGPLWARTLRMSIYISSFDLRMGEPLSIHVVLLFYRFIIYIIYGFGLWFFLLDLGLTACFGLDSLEYGHSVLEGCD